jgi:hypothetical protein
VKAATEAVRIKEMSSYKVSTVSQFSTYQKQHQSVVLKTDRKAKVKQ